MKEMKRQNGFTMIELMMTVLIIAVASAFIAKVIFGIGSSMKISQLRDMHIQMVSTVSQYFSGSHDFTTLTTAVGVDGKLVPTELRSGTGASAKIVFGGAEGTLGPDANRTDLFFVAYDRLPNENCASFVSSLEAQALRVEISQAGGGSYTKVKDLAPTSGLPIAFNPGLLATQCAAASPTFAVRFTQN